MWWNDTPLQHTHRQWWLGRPAEGGVMSMCRYTVTSYVHNDSYKTRWLELGSRPPQVPGGCVKVSSHTDKVPGDRARWVSCIFPIRLRGLFHRVKHAATLNAPRSQTENICENTVPWQQ